ncbi:MAG: hypothetical protein LBK41_06510 [Clostridiales bacterium]|nr:hypothetical protein [Clostridiales bacterium]
MAFILAIGSVPAGGVSAAVKYSLNARFDNKLTPGKTNTIPTLASGGLGRLTGSEALIEWAFQNPDGVPLDVGAALLQYPVGDGKVAQLTVAKSVGKATVDFDVYDAGGAFDTIAGGRRLYLDSATDAFNGDYYIHSPLGGGERWVSVSSFNNIDSAAGYYADKSSAKPRFAFNRGQGFSFKFANQTVHFLWDASADIFYVQSDAFAPGLVFPVSLFISRQVNPAVFPAPAQINVLTGIPASDITSRPLSNGRDLSYTLKHTGSDREEPAESPNLMEVSINIPRVWDEVSGAFVTAPADRPAVELKLTLSNNVTPAQVIIDNIWDPGAGCSASGAGFYGGAAPARAGGKITFTLGKSDAEGLPYGRLYEGMSGFGMPPGTGDYVFNSSVIGYGVFYTFPRYQVALIGDDYYAVVDPFQGYKGYYRLLVDRNKSVTVYSDGVNPIYMPLALDAASGFIHYYQVLFSPGVTFESAGAVVVQSQEMHHEAGDESLSVGAANNFTILSRRFIPLDELSPDPDRDFKGELKLELRWEIARENTLRKILESADDGIMEITYDVYKTVEPYAAKPDGTPDYSAITVLDSVTLRLELEPGGDISVSYSDTNGMLDPDGVPLKRYLTGNNVNANDHRVIQPVVDVVSRAYVTLTTVAADKDAPNLAAPVSDIDFFYPNIYFLNTKPVRIALNRGGSLVDDALTVGESLYDSMTLDSFSRLSPPPPQNPAASASDVMAALGVSWLVPGRQIRDYLDGSYKYDQSAVTFDLFISQKEDGVKRLADAEREERASPPAVAAAFDTLWDGSRLDMSALTADLRRGDTVAVTGIPISTDAAVIAEVLDGAARTADWELANLDKNQRYYFAAHTRADFYTGGALKKSAYSELTGIFGEVTRGDEDKPSEGDKTPPAPSLSLAETGLSSAVISWPAVTEPNAAENGVSYAYEIIRVTGGARFTEAMLNSRLTLDETFGRLSGPDKMKLRTDGGMPPGVAFDQASDPLALTDASLAPNTLYFYYARTVRTTASGEMLSVWSEIAVTTTPVKPPENLRVVRDDGKIDRQRAFIIEWDAPITDLARLGQQINFELTVTRGDGETGVPMTIPTADLVSRPAGRDGYTTFRYAVTRMYEGGQWSALAAGELYAARVRIADADNGDASAWSNTAYARTETDPVQDARDDRKNVWLGYLADELNKLNDSYWRITESGKRQTAFARPDRFAELLTRSVGSAVELPSGGDSLRWYIPDSALSKADLANMGFAAERDGASLRVQPGSIPRREGLSDWYALIEFSRRDYGGSVAGSPALNGVVTVSVSIVAARRPTSETDALVSQGIFDALADYIKDSGYGDKLSALIEKDADALVISAYVNGVIADAGAAAEKAARRAFAADLGRAYAAETLAKAFYIGQDTGGAASGYRWEYGYWRKQATILSAGTALVQTAWTGEFAFAAEGGGLPEIAAKYGLSEYLGSDANKPLSGWMLSGATALLTGMKPGGDPAAHLKSKGYSLALKDADAADFERTLHAVMAVFEIRTGARAAGVVITDYGQINGVRNLDAWYKPYVRAAYALGAASGAADAKAGVTVGEYLEMLARVKDKAKL